MILLATFRIKNYETDLETWYTMRIFAIAFSTFALAFTISAQSGRRIQPTPTPAPSSVEDPVTFSESTPQKKRPVAVWPSLRGSIISKGSSTPSPSTTNADSTVSVASDGDEVVKVDTNLVTIPVSVFDRHGLYIPNLQKDDFRIFEDGKEQQVEYFGTSEKPFTVILLIDTSPSTDYEIDEIRAAATAFVDQLKPQDKVMVIEFDGNVQVLTEATGDRPTIYKAIKKADFGGGTALYDAVTFSLSKRLNAIDGRKAIVLFTDGVDTVSSKSNYDTTLALAEEADSLIFPVYYNTYNATRGNTDVWAPAPPGTTSREYAVGKKYLEELAAYTGGRVFRPEATPGGLTKAFEGIAEELRRQYNIGYIPSEDGKAGQRRQIRVRVSRPNLVLRARDSYIVGSK
ncbi:MAG: VWA domain-containing protein [Blastocatellia bacterium]|nr:VWA domain-containing protein [Blastocatellia bacterium]